MMRALVLMSIIMASICSAAAEVEIQVSPRQRALKIFGPTKTVTTGAFRKLV